VRVLRVGEPVRVSARTCLTYPIADERRAFRAKTGERSMDSGIHDAEERIARRCRISTFVARFHRCVTEIVTPSHG